MVWGKHGAVLEKVFRRQGRRAVGTIVLRSEGAEKAERNNPKEQNLEGSSAGEFGKPAGNFMAGGA